MPLITIFLQSTCVIKPQFFIWFASLILTLPKLAQRNPKKKKNEEGLEEKTHLFHGCLVVAVGVER